MQICFPVESDKGLESVVHGHFGSAPVFIVFDTESRLTDVIENSDLGHEHGMCSPLKALDGKTVDAIVVGGIGGGAIGKLNALGIKVYVAAPGTIEESVHGIEEGTLAELTVEYACSGHAGGCCGH